MHKIHSQLPIHIGLVEFHFPLLSIQSKNPSQWPIPKIKLMHQPTQYLETSSGKKMRVLLSSSKSNYHILSIYRPPPINAPPLFAPQKNDLREDEKANKKEGL